MGAIIMPGLDTVWDLVSHVELTTETHADFFVVRRVVYAFLVPRAPAEAWTAPTPQSPFGLGTLRAVWYHESDEAHFDIYRRIYPTCPLLSAAAQVLYFSQPNLWVRTRC